MGERKDRTLNTNRKPQPRYKDMTTKIKRIVALLFITALLAVVGMGCNTAHGFGKDMEKAGDKIQEGTK